MNWNSALVVGGRRGLTSEVAHANASDDRMWTDDSPETIRNLGDGHRPALLGGYDLRTVPTGSTPYSSRTHHSPVTERQDSMIPARVSPIDHHADTQQTYKQS